jgi:transcription termination/antitermination protein NusA
MDIKNFISSISQIAEEKGIPTEKVIETVEMAIAAAYKKDYGKKGQIIKAKLDPETGQSKFWQVKTVVDEKMLYNEEDLERIAAEKEKKGFSEEEAKEEKIRFNSERHLILEEAKEIDPKAEVGQEIEIPLETKEGYGRIASQTAKQVILQKIREAEKESILGEYKSKEGEIISGVVQRMEGRNIFFDIGKTLAILPREEQVPGEFYRPGQRFKTFLLKVEETSRGPAVILSRAYPKFISKLFELEVPEVSSGQIKIRSIAREAGSRSKISVATETEGIDPIGSMVGQKGTRVMAVINELGGEKIDIVEYSENPEKYIANSLSPAKVLEVKIMPKNKALVVVPEDQLSLAIGKSGQNVRLAAKLTGWKIDVKSPEGETISIEETGTGKVRMVEELEEEKEKIDSSVEKTEEKPAEKPKKEKNKTAPVKEKKEKKVEAEPDGKKEKKVIKKIKNKNN